MLTLIYLIGIAGPSGAGKSFLARHLAAELQGDVLELDRYYRDLSHLSPEALEHELLIEQVGRLRKSETVHLPVYDFTTHTRSPGVETLQPSKVVILEGLFTLHWPGLRELLGTKVYVDLSDDICLARRTVRDIQERGRTPTSVLEQYETTVAPMALRYVRPSIAHADVVVGGADRIEDGVSRIVEHYHRSGKQ